MTRASEHCSADRRRRRPGKLLVGLESRGVNSICWPWSWSRDRKPHGTAISRRLRSRFRYARMRLFGKLWCRGRPKSLGQDMFSSCHGALGCSWMRTNPCERPQPARPGNIVGKIGVCARSRAHSLLQVCPKTACHSRNNDLSGVFSSLPIETF
jgi:hypothetical protein